MSSAVLYMSMSIDGFIAGPNERDLRRAWRAPLFVLTDHPEDAEPVDGVTFLDCDVAEAVRIGLDAADGKNLEVFSPSTGTPLLERGLIDEVDLHVLPRLLGDGTRRYDVAGGSMRKLRNLGRR
jgi:hypothetical protein